MNYFELLELPIGFKVDVEQAQKNFKKLQRKYHPDFNVNATEAEAENNLEISSKLNKAWQIFKDENKTIEYILQLNGIIKPEEKYNLNEAFLIEMMDINDILIEDKSKAQQMILDLKNQILQSEEEILLKPIKECTNEDWVLLKENYYKKKYLDRLLEQ